MTSLTSYTRRGPANGAALGGRFVSTPSLVAALCGIAVAACSGSGARTDADAGATASSTAVPSLPVPVGTEPTTTMPMTPTAPPMPATTAPAGGSGGMGGGGATGAPDAGVGGTPPVEQGPVCDIVTPSVFSRSDTDDSWDDNDFSDVILSGTCPLLVDVTWPHEEGWENADPAEANREQTRFTLDAYRGPDLTNQQINLTIELTDHQLGPAATAAGYIVSIVSVSTYDRVVISEPPAVIDAGLGDGGLLSDAGFTTDAGALVDGGFSSDAVDAGPAETDEPVTTVTTGYAEAETGPEDQALLRRVGDRATVIFRVPNKTEAVDSYDPSRVIKINVRIYNAFTGEAVGGGDIVPAADGGLTLDGGVDAGADAGAEDADALDAGNSLSTAELGIVEDASVGMSDAGVGVPAPATGPVYDYLTSQFAITSFTISEVTGL